jgi:hypothetical protein
MRLSLLPNFRSFVIVKRSEFDEEELNLILVGAAKAVARFSTSFSTKILKVFNDMIFTRSNFKLRIL